MLKENSFMATCSWIADQQVHEHLRNRHTYSFRVVYKKIKIKNKMVLSPMYQKERKKTKVYREYAFFFSSFCCMFTSCLISVKRYPRSFVEGSKDGESISQTNKINHVLQNYFSFFFVEICCHGGPNGT